MRFFYIIFVLVIIFTYCLESDAAADKGLEFSISLDKGEYKLKDPIQLDLKLENKSNKGIYVNKRFFINPEDSPKEAREVTIAVISPSGERLPYRRTYETGLPKTDYFVLLNPGEEVTLDRKRNLKAYFDIKELGTYKITATYQNVHGGEIGIDAFKDKIKSNSITIKVIE